MYKGFGFHLVREITIGEFLYTMLARKIPSVPSFTLSKAIVSGQLFVERGRAAKQNGIFILKHLRCSPSLVCIHPLLVMQNKEF